MRHAPMFTVEEVEALLAVVEAAKAVIDYTLLNGLGDGRVITEYLRTMSQRLAALTEE